MKNEKLKGQIRAADTRDTSTNCSHVYQVSIFYASQFLRKVWQKNLMFESWREGKMKNKGTTKQRQPDSGIYDISAHWSRVYLISTV